MARKHNHHGGNRRNARHGTTHAPVVRAPITFERKVPVVYGKPFILLEDDQKATFIYKEGRWLPHAMTIAECREECQVKELQQKINGMTRYEICAPLPSAD